jgi:transcriptional regulator with XRE-family HTH domain
MDISDALAANIRSVRARRQLSQTEVGKRMQYLGFTPWVRQTVSGVENAQRRATAEEIVGLARALDTTVMSLMDLSGNGAVFFPNGRETVDT